MNKTLMRALDKLSKYRYGILYNDGAFVSDKDQMARRDGTDIVVQTPQMMDQHKSGMCHDASIYIDAILTKLGIEHKCVYIASNVKPMEPTHSFVMALDEPTSSWVCIDVFAAEDCIWPIEEDRKDNLVKSIDQRVAAWIVQDNDASADLEVFTLDHLPNGGCGFVQWTQQVVDQADYYEFDYGYSHLSYNGVGVYQALKLAAGWRWRDLLRDQRINWLPTPPDYNGSLESWFTMRGYREFKRQVMPIIGQWLDPKLLEETYTSKINVSRVVYADEYQVIIRKSKKQNKRRSNRLDLVSQELMSSSTSDHDAFMAPRYNCLTPIWINQFKILNEYVQSPQLTPVPKQLLIDIVKSLRTKTNSSKTLTYKEIYEKLETFDYQYCEEFKKNLLAYNASNGHLTVAVLSNDESTIHNWLDCQFDFLKVNEIIRDLASNPTGMTQSWSKDLENGLVTDKNVVIVVNRDLVLRGQDWKDTLQHQITHFIQRVVGLKKSLERKMQYFGSKPVDEALQALEEEIVSKTTLDKSLVSAGLRRFIAYCIRPTEQDPTLKSCLNCFQRRYQLVGHRQDRLQWLRSQFDELTPNLSSQAMAMIDRNFAKQKLLITSFEEMNQYKFTFATLIFKIFTCLGYDVKTMLEDHFKTFKARDI